MEVHLNPVLLRLRSGAGVLVLGFQRTRPITESAFRISFQPDWQIDNDFLTGQSWRVLKSRYTSGDPEQGFRHCFADELNQSLVSSVAQATTSRRERDICYNCRELLYHLGGGKG